MNYIPTPISDLWLLEPKVYTDERGYFYESYRADELAEYAPDFAVVQENQSCSRRGVLRGLHLQREPYAQAKLVRCPVGRVVDVAVDLRRGSPTYRHHYAVELSESNHRQLFIPRGFAHGFLTLSEVAVLQYRVDRPYAPNHELSLRYDVPELAIDWRLYGVEEDELLVSERDKQGLLWAEYLSRL